MMTSPARHSVHQTLLPQNTSVGTPNRRSYSHRRNKNKSTGLEQEFLSFAGTDDVMMKTKNSRLQYEMC